MIQYKKPSNNKTSLYINIITIIAIGMILNYLLAWGYMNVYITSYLKNTSLPDITTNQINFLFTISLVSQVPGFYMTGPIAKRIGYKKTIIVGIFALSICHL